MDVARVMIIWSYVAPDSEDGRRARRLRPHEPERPALQLGRRSTRRWTSCKRLGHRAGRRRHRAGPDLGEPRQGASRTSATSPTRRSSREFATAAAKRYGAQVDRWLIWNEPNVNSWLLPQQELRKGGKCVPVAPALYRDARARRLPGRSRREDPGSTVLARHARAARPDADRSTRANVRPLAFLRAFGCVDAKLRPERKSRYCKSGFKAPGRRRLRLPPARHAVRADEEASRTRTRPASPTSAAACCRRSTASRRRGRFLNAGSRTKKFDVYFTEYGYQTNPPDPYQGVSTTEQLNWVQQGAYLSWRQPRVKMMIQYLWRDDPVGDRGQGSAAYSGWQSGLYSFDGRKKPLRDAFPNPSGSTCRRARRPRRSGARCAPAAAASVTVQKKNGSSWSTLRSVDDGRERLLRVHDAGLEEDLVPLPLLARRRAGYLEHRQRLEEDVHVFGDDGRRRVRSSVREHTRRRRVWQTAPR